MPYPPFCPERECVPHFTKIHFLWLKKSNFTITFNVLFYCTFVHITVLKQSTKRGVPHFLLALNPWFYVSAMDHDVCSGPSREGERGKFSRVPRNLGGPTSARKYWNGCYRCSLSDLKYAYNPFSVAAAPRIPLEELTMLPQTPSRMVNGHSSPHFLPLFSVSISAPTEWGCVRAPR